MTLRKVDGRWEADFRFKGFPRLHLSLGRIKKGEAEAQYDAVRKLFRQNRRDMIAQLLLPKGHPQRMTPERLAQMVEHHEPLVPIPAPPPAPPPEETTPARSPWGTVDQIGAKWLASLETHPKKRVGTFKVRRAQFRRFAAFLYTPPEDAPAGAPSGRVGAMDFDAVTSDVVGAYQAHLVAAAVPANTITGYMVGVGALWRWVEKEEARRAREQRRAPRPVYSPIDRERLHTDVTSRERYLTPAEGDRLLAATPEPLLVIICLALFAGLRLEEALYLRPVDVDLELGLLAVREKPLPDGTTWKPKTERSKRVVPIGPSLRAVLVRHLAGAFSGERWITPRPADAEFPWSDRTFHHHVQAIVARAGLPPGRKDPNGVTYHTLRHTFASQLVSHGVDLYTVAKLLGDSLQVVENTYAHLSPDVKRAAVAKLATVFSLPDPAATDHEKMTQDVTQEGPA